MMKHALVCLLAACGSNVASGPDAAVSGGPDADSSGKRTLDTCATSIAADAPSFYQEYKCATITTASDGTVTIASQDLPPHDSYYYADGDPNHVAFDTQGNTHFANPNRLSQQNVHIEIPADPIAKGITITPSMIDEQAGNSSDEYPLGTIGVALDSVSLYTGTAAPGDDINQEQYTFDSYDGHPSPDGAYHYHGPAPGPLEVTGGPEIYGILCDGTVVLGCTELDGSDPGTLDAQGGHLGDIGTYFTNRYHVHVCATGRTFTPEIQYYTTCNR